MHTFDVYWLWLCLCVALVLLVVEPKQNSNDSAFFVLHIVCKNQKLYFSESFRWVESFNPSCLFPVSYFLDGTAAAAATTTTMTQNNGIPNTAFDELPLV